jgi:hypothetical protein
MNHTSSQFRVWSLALASTLLFAGCGDDGPSCPTYLTVCDDECVDLDSSPDHCGECGEACTYANGVPACALGECYLVDCETNFADCDGNAANGCEGDFLSGARTCGDCNFVCGVVEACSEGECGPAGGTQPTTFKIASLGTTGCFAFQHSSATGDDRGGIATSRAGYYYNGDDALGAFQFGSTWGGEFGPAVRDGIFSNLATGDLYSLTVGGAPLEDDGCTTVDGFIRLDPFTMLPVGSATALSSSLNICGGGSPRGMFAGFGFLLVHDGTNTHEINLANGNISSLGSGANLSGASTCENWAIWGVAERFGGETYMVFRLTSNLIVRRAVSNGNTETILDLNAIEDSTGGAVGDMCSIAVDVARGRWVYHDEYISGMLGAPNVDTDEVVGDCPATFQHP